MRVRKDLKLKNSVRHVNRVYLQFENVRFSFFFIWIRPTLSTNDVTYKSYKFYRYQYNDTQTRDSYDSRASVFQKAFTAKPYQIEAVAEPCEASFQNIIFELGCERRTH